MLDVLNGKVGNVTEVQSLVQFIVEEVHSMLVCAPIKRTLPWTSKLASACIATYPGR